MRRAHERLGRVAEIDVNDLRARAAAREIGLQLERAVRRAALLLGLGARRRLSVDRRHADAAHASREQARPQGRDHRDGGYPRAPPPAGTGGAESTIDGSLGALRAHHFVPNVGEGVFADNVVAAVPSDVLNPSSKVMIASPNDSSQSKSWSNREKVGAICKLSQRGFLTILYP